MPLPNVSAAAAGLTPARQQALSYLMEAFQASLDLGNEPSAFACQLASLERLGVTETTLRWLVSEGLAAHCLETTRPKQHRRTFRPTANLGFTSASCFLLTPAGVVFARGLKAIPEPRRDAAHEETQGPLPHFAERTLTMYGLIVKRFKGPVGNQERICLAYQEDNWTVHLFDPLPGKEGIDSKTRLNQTLKNLNKHQVNRLLYFRGDGTGTGVFWEPILGPHAVLT